ncbi:4-(cytidine 5'-diphospho)-2-C-methyl-D-erythritol kinase [bacterium]|nr:4-(cytidine 5'-diphospho)-2-C-methyl-D-erythritol kinase [bacterium]
MIYKSHAKVNLALDILGQDKNGYHFVQTVLQKIPLFDEINIEEFSENLIIFEGKEGPFINDTSNTVSEAMKLLKPSKKYKITVKKNIPVGSGLGGGSSNAATVLNAINEIGNLGFSKDGLREMGVKIGIDVPFFIEPGTAVGGHYGEKIEILPDFNLENFYTILIIPKEGKITKSMYEKIDIKKCGQKKSQSEEMIRMMKSMDSSGILSLMHNDFETIDEVKTPQIKNASTILCGSGTTVFGISNSPFDFEELSQELPHLRILDLRQ